MQLSFKIDLWIYGIDCGHSGEGQLFCERNLVRIPHNVVQTLCSLIVWLDS